MLLLNRNVGLESGVVKTNSSISYIRLEINGKNGSTRAKIFAEVKAKEYESIKAAMRKYQNLVNLS